MGGVYKLAAEEDNGVWEPRIKLSDNPEKVTIPGIKKVFRLVDKESGKIKADLVALEDEVLDLSSSITLYDPDNTWLRMKLEPERYTAYETMIPVIEHGKRVYTSPPVMAIRDYATKQKDLLWDEHKRLVNPQPVPVDLSDRLYDLRKKMIYDARNINNGKG